MEQASASTLIPFPAALLILPLKIYATFVYEEKYRVAVGKENSEIAEVSNRFLAFLEIINFHPFPVFAHKISRRHSLVAPVGTAVVVRRRNAARRACLVLKCCSFYGAPSLPASPINFRLCPRDCKADRRDAAPHRIRISGWRKRAELPILRRW